ncbi:MAG: ADP-ribosylation factor-like protein [Candidatus Heimdallarchaeaceae archaeon]
MSYLFDELSGKKGSATEIEDKILLMGLQAAGKTAIKDVVFFNKEPEEVNGYMATVHYQRQFLDEEQTSMIIDSGGQESYWNEAVTHFRHLVFSNVKLLIWIIDVTKPELFEESERRFSFTIRQFKKENPDGNITVLCHKVDLVTPEQMVVIHQHIREMFADTRFEVDFENTSIYYKDSLRELLFTIMAEAGINTKRFELVSNVGQKVEESEEFQSYVLEHAEDEKVEILRDYLNPEPTPLLPTFGKLNFQLDLTDYDIIEIVLIDKKTHSPITGASSNASVSAENSMEYLVALHDFKSRIKDNTEEIDPTGDILTSDSGKVHAMLFDLANNYLIITSFSPISDERKELLFQLILKFAQSTAEVSPPEPTEQVVIESTTTVVTEPAVEIVSEPEPVVAEVVEEPIEIAEVAPSTEIEVDALVDKVVSQPTSKAEEVEIFEEIPVVEAEPVQVEEESFFQKEKIVIAEVAVDPEEIVSAPKEVPEPEPISEIMEAVKEDVEEYPPVPEKLDEAVELPEPPAVEVEEIVQEERHAPSPESLDMKLKQQFSDIVEEREVKIEEPLESIAPPVPQVVKVVEEVSAQDVISEPEVVEEVIPEPEPVVVMEEPSPESVQEEVGATDTTIDFSAADIQDFASFLVQKKEIILDEDFKLEDMEIKMDDIKSLSAYLFSGSEKKTEEIKEEIKEEIETTD